MAINVPISNGYSHWALGDKKSHAAEYCLNQT